MKVVGVICFGAKRVLAKVLLTGIPIAFGSGHNAHFYNLKHALCQWQGGVIEFLQRKIKPCVALLLTILPLKIQAQSLS